MTEPLAATYVLEYPYHRSVGPVIGRFLTALRDRRIIGVRAADGRVLLPPIEYDPQTGDAIDEIVDLADRGEVTSWTWVDDPRPNHPLQRPFAFALIRIDGADTSMLHAVDARDQAAMRTGMRVCARWRDKTEGTILDIACFEPEAS
jgi:uncharacterized OB-fold protein